MSESDDLRKRLERLGVRLGVQGLRTPQAAPAAAPALPAPPRDAIEDWVSGQVVEHDSGSCFVSETRYPLAHIHGALTLGHLLGDTPAALGVLAGELEAATDFCGLVFLDTETTGLAGGTGTYAFLVGLGVFEGEEFVLRQYFMRDIPEEGAMLALVRKVLEPHAGLVTFNGRAFDWPLLETRFAMNRQPLPSSLAACHLDLLLPARRLWRMRLQSCALASLEEQVLGVQRSEDDIPGWAIPGLYRDYLAWGRAEPLRRVFYHNAHDILSMATLAALLCRSVREPLQALTHGEDLYSLGRQYEGQDDLEMAVLLYQHSLRGQLAPKTRQAIMHRLSQIHRRAGQPQEATALWHALAERGDFQACIELAKYYEHRMSDLAQAQKMAVQALGLLRQLRYPDRKQLAETEHRLRRLEEKLRKRQCSAPSPATGSVPDCSLPAQGSEPGT